MSVQVKNSDLPVNIAPPLPPGASRIIANHNNAIPSLSSSTSSLNLRSQDPRLRPSVGTQGGIQGQNNQLIYPQNAKKKAELNKIDESLKMSSKNFDPKLFISHKLKDATAIEIEKFSNSLIDMNNKAMEDINENLENSNFQILQVSKRVIGIQQELNSVRKLINELQENSSTMKESAEQKLSINNKSPASSTTSLITTATAGGKQSNSFNRRQSVVLLEKMWTHELNSLYKHVEGAQKYLPAIPGRHVIAESGTWVELNSATWKPLQPSHIFILNDHILIATRKRRKAGDASSSNGAINLTVDQCFPLREVQLSDLGTTTIPNKSKQQIEVATIQFKYGALPYVYQTERLDHYQKVMTAFRKARDQEESSATTEKKERRIGEESMNYLSLKDNEDLLQLMSINSNGNGNLRLKGNGNQNSNDFNGRAKMIQKVDDIMSELDINIARHNYEEAVELIKKCKEVIKESPSSQDKNKSNKNNNNSSFLKIFMESKLKIRIQELKEKTTFELSLENIKDSEINKYLSILKNIDLEDDSINIFLNIKSKLIHKRIQKVEFQGEIFKYINQVSIITFQLIKSSILLYQQNFKNKLKISKLVAWVQDEVKQYIDLYERQLYGEGDFSIIKSCVLATKHQAEQLKSVGMSMDYLLVDIYNKVV